METKKVANYALYERMKTDWISCNPDASPEQYESEMARISALCGV